MIFWIYVWMYYFSLIISYKFLKVFILLWLYKRKRYKNTPI